ncbi:NPC intracellular cholesterol transporter 2 homolog a [Apis florea]|uniref:NPC intracellular cholesterol transporter 2 homolog a n=1 Tax=Apis florea TaxID=7463 RepID=UPI000629773D|nr:NPC intracellular cholesterol transporter 2 homolog a [Apis florea]
MRGTILVFVALLVVVCATEVNHCGTGEKFEDSNQVRITGCDVPPCKLKRRTKASVEQKFVPSKDVASLVNSVNAAVLGVPLPFVGVDGTSACDNIYNLDGTPAGCSLKKDVEYLYKREFPVLQIYPTVKTNFSRFLRPRFYYFSHRIVFLNGIGQISIIVTSKPILINRLSCTSRV